MEKGEEGLELDTSVGFLELLESGDGSINLDGNNNKKMMKKKGLMCPQPQIPHSSPSPSTYCYSGRMLCFGGEDDGYVGGVKRSINRSETSSFTSSSTCTNSGVSKHKGKGERVDVMSNNTSGQKKPRKGQQSGSSNCGATKVKKEKLGERIMALQQLVSPFGKSDTSSVLHEAMGYIKFLHDQVQVLSSPYLQQLPPSNTIRDGGGEARMDLRGRGLCLVPISCTTHVVGSNGADLWSPAMGSTNINHPYNT